MTTTITLRAVKGSALTFTEVDNNFSNLKATADAAYPATNPNGYTGNEGTVTSVSMSGGTTGLTFTGGPVTGSGTFTASGTLDVANGGTGANNVATARAVLGVVSSGGPNNLSGSFTVNPVNASGSSPTFSATSRNMFRYTNSGAFTISAPISDNGYTILVEITNAVGAGALTTTGFTYANTSAFNSDVDAKFIAQITSFGPGRKYLHIIKASA